MDKSTEISDCVINKSLKRRGVIAFSAEDLKKVANCGMRAKVRRMKSKCDSSDVMIVLTFTPDVPAPKIKRRKRACPQKKPKPCEEPCDESDSSGES